MTKKKTIIVALSLTLILISLLLGGCMEDIIHNENDAYAYMKQGTEEKYGREVKFLTPMEIDYVGNVSKKIVDDYVFQETIFTDDPSKVFRVSCTPAGQLADDYAEHIFQENAQIIADNHLSQFGFINDYQVKLEMRGTHKIWKEGDSFEDYMTTGGIRPNICFEVHLSPNLSEKEYNHQIWQCLQEMYQEDYGFNLRVGITGGDIYKKPIFLYDSFANARVNSEDEVSVEMRRTIL